jgi:hypothetical protein
LVSGGDQIAQKGKALSFPIVVIATDSSGHSLAGQKITFAVTGGGGSVAPETVTTHRGGLAATTWTLGPTDGLQTLTASVGVIASIVTVTATATRPSLAITGDPFDSYYNANASFIPTLAIGQYFDAWVAPSDLSVVTAPLPVTFSQTGSLVVDVPANVTIPAGATYAQFRITGVSIGIDSLVLSAPGYAPLKAYFIVDLGAVNLALNSHPTSSPRVGETKEVVLCASGLFAMPVTFAIAADTNIRFVTEEVPPVVMSSATLPPDNECTYFAVQALAAGSARVTLTNPNFRTFTTTIVVTP